MIDAVNTKSFQALGLNAEIVQALSAVGHERPTEVQAATVPAVLEGRDVHAQAETGSGKTLAFGVPLLQRLAGQSRTSSLRGNPVAALVLVPTRELAVQVATVLAELAGHLAEAPRVLAVHGGVKINPQMMDLRGGVDVLVATPGRLLDLQRQNAVELSTLRILVLDEADRMLSLGFQQELHELFELFPADKQTLLFSATYPPELKPLVDVVLAEPLIVHLAAVHTEALILQQVFEVEPARKRALLMHLLQERDLQQVLIFVSMKKTGDKLAQRLNQAGISAAVFHGEKKQAQRLRGLAEFRSGQLRILIATDLAARGLDIEELPTVINYELPRSPNDYTHRIGRTGRAGKQGTAISLIAPSEFQHFRVIEKRIKKRLVRQRVPGFEPLETLAR